MARMRFLCDVERCIDCAGCSIACKEGHNVPVGINRRRVIPINEGEKRAFPLPACTALMHRV